MIPFKCKYYNDVFDFWWAMWSGDPACGYNAMQLGDEFLTIDFIGFVIQYLYFPLSPTHALHMAVMHSYTYVV